MIQSAPLKYCPASGSIVVTGTADEYRQKYPKLLWIVNPWTGSGRNPDDVMYDPKGLMIIPPGTLELLKVGQAIARASHELPDGWELRVCIQNGSASLELYDPDGGTCEPVLDEEGLGEEIQVAVATAIRLESGETDEQGGQE